MFHDPLATHPPCLPQNDPDNIVVRQNMIERRRMLFNFTKFTRLTGFTGTFELPPLFFPIPPSYTIPIQENMYGYVLKLLERKMVGDANEELRKKFTSPLRSLQDYANAVGILKPTPKIITQNEKDLWKWLSDEEFTRQRLQGLNPEKIELVEEAAWVARFGPTGSTPFNLESVRQEIDAVIAKRGGTDFATALSQRDIYVLDYSIFTLSALSTIAESFNRYVAAPITVFFRNNNDRSLYPIGIQYFPGIADSNPVFVPDGSPDWLLAKIWVNSIDGQYQEVISHLYEVHFMAEVFQVSMNRQLGSDHPIFQLLHPHFFATLFVNQMAKTDLLASNGAINEVIGSGVPGARVLINEYNKTFNFQEHSFENSLKKRGMYEDRVAGYLWAEDGKRLWQVFHTFVEKVLRIFYHSEEDLLRDFELQQWIAELEAPRGADLKGVSENGGKIHTVEYLTDLLTNLLWICTAKHSSGNIAQLELYGFIPNVPAALYSPPPTSRGKIDHQAILDALPPQDKTLAQIAIVYLLSDTGAHGHLLPKLKSSSYPGLNKNPEAKAAISEFHHSLEQLSKDIAVRNANLTYPYNSLDPAKIDNSIYV